MLVSSRVLTIVSMLAPIIETQNNKSL